ncbi:YecA family protein [Vibrio sp. SS-MA-C1-2]|uniref:YecA/YgfB family protein n=1 Tax=Vibrio sp. SS-MA-C1-2 TaxID=2908646 RepID=UPI001F1C261F|nr:YecA family protein [Vibrio sp. SS-MA-C1-2]UJF19044.1 YecA family protein [Vibrio sp. SS-MA-C1-2]
MSKTTLPEYIAVESALKTDGLAVMPAELHGLLTGMISGGLPLDNSWQPLLNDYTNEGMAWPRTAKQVATELYQATVDELNEGEFSLTLLLPTEEGNMEQLVDQAEALTQWVNHFMSGIGLSGLKLDSAPNEIKEIFADLQQIAQLGIDEESDLEEQANLLEQVIEHVRVCALTCHTEFGQKRSEQASE